MDDRLRRHEYGFLELVSPPDDETLKTYYAQKYYQSESGNYRKSYSPEEMHAIRLRVEMRARRADDLRKTNAPGKLLDVGCGEGFVLSAYEALGWEVKGMDHSIDGVTAMNPDQVGNVAQGDLFGLLEEQVSLGAQYDLVWLANVLEHVRDPVRLLRTLYSIVDPGGLLVVTVPNDGSAYHEALYSSGSIPERFWIAIPDHLSYFTAASLTQTAEATGWQVRDMQGDFPIDLYLSHNGSNYVRDRANGPAAHAARLQLEALIGEAGIPAANAFYSALAAVGLGRNITTYLCPQSEELS